MASNPTTVRSGSLYEKWDRGPSRDANYFPIGVWLQSPRHAVRYKDAGINLYVGLWQGPTPQQLADLQAAGMTVICSQNGVGLDNLSNPTIVGWMHGDEPDNAQALRGERGYGPPISPAAIRSDYQRIHASDPTRPILLNLGQGVAWDNYIGRGVRRNHPEDYLEYIVGGDIVSFDIYPVVHDDPRISGKLEYVGRGVGRLVEWSKGEKVVWNCIECTHISNPSRRATPEQVRSEVWMALTHGSRGLIYFVHQFKPVFQEAALLEDPEMLAAVTAINREVRELAAALNSPDLRDGVQVEVNRQAALRSDARTTVPATTPPVAWLQKECAGTTYLFTVNMGNEPISVEFEWSGAAKVLHAEVLNENRKIQLQDGRFRDLFKPYAVHLYAARTSR